MYKIRLRLKKKNNYSIVVLKINKKFRLNRIVEVLGSYDSTQKKLILNIFRLIFWFSKETKICGKVVKLLNLFNILF